MSISEAGSAASADMRAAERAKWDEVYRDLALEPESPPARAFNEQFARLVCELLPEGGRVLEAGCGAGSQSLALARTGRFEIHLLDFSQHALAYARRLFEQEGLPANSQLADVYEPGEPEFDLVFNAGVLEHYTADEQVEFLKGMASRSRDLVLVLVPNRLCYWYWLWRAREVELGNWPYGKEVPLDDLRAVFERAGLRFLGQAFLAETWTEDFVRNLTGLDPDLRDMIYEIHRSGIVPQAQRGYLLAALGTLRKKARVVPEVWQSSYVGASFDQAQAAATLTEALALRVQADHDLRGLRKLRVQLEQQLAAAQSSLEAERAAALRAQQELTAAGERTQQMQAELAARTAEAARLEQALGEQQRISEQFREAAAAAEREAEARIARVMADLEARRQQLDAERGILEAHAADLRRAFDASESRALAAERELNEIKASMSYALMRRMTRLRRILAPDGSPQHRAMRVLFDGLKAVKRAVFGLLGLIGGIGGGIGGGVGRGLRGGIRRIGNAVLFLPARIAAAIRARQMNWYAYAFDTFKRQRMRAYPGRLERVGVPAERGLVSIVLPVYNGEDYVRESIDSVLAQTYERFELIVVDDGSSDRTPQILADYAARDPRIRVITQKNQKLPRALSNGFRAARGEFLTWTSADNRFKPRFLEKMVSSLQRHPAWDMIYADVDIIGDDGKPLLNSGWYYGYQRPPGSEHIFMPLDPSELNVIGNNYVGAAFLYRKRVPYLIGEYSPRLFGLEDYDYWMRVNALCSLRHADFQEPVYDYRMHDNSLTARDKELKITARRDRHMFFEEFRRNFYFEPLLWVIEADGSTGAGSKLSRRLRRQIRRTGHSLFTREQLNAFALPRLWVGCVYCRLVDGRPEQAAPPDDLPAGTLRVLLYTGPEPLPEQIADGWDLCIATHPAARPVGLKRPWQGWLAAERAEELFTVIDTRCKAEHLDRIEAYADSPPAPQVELSVIICAYKRSQRLEQALAAVAQQRIDRGCYELIVVNNAPSDRAVAEVVEETRRKFFADDPQRLRLIDCPVVGLSHARNAGLAEARGSFVAYLDDDSVPAASWMSVMLGRLRERPDVGIMSGRITLKDPPDPPRWMTPEWRMYWSHYNPGYKEYTEISSYWELPYAGNWVVRRELLLSIGGYRTRYGRKGNDFGGGEELIAARMIQQMGWKIGFEPESEVIHDVEPHRFTLHHVAKTARAATLVHYQTQVDLHLPMEASIECTQRELWRTLREGFDFRRPAAERFRSRAYAWAYVRLLRRQIIDALARCRLAVTASKK